VLGLVFLPLPVLLSSGIYDVFYTHLVNLTPFLFEERQSRTVYKVRFNRGKIRCMHNDLWMVVLELQQFN
jgi:hypothetical protein